MATHALPSSPARIAAGEKIWPYYLLFFVSGFPALLYQIVWQRALFTIYGVNIESVTIIVTVFMLGLGLGSVAGGRLSTYPRIKALRAFGAIEVSIGAFGIVSLPLFHRVAEFTAGSSTAATGVVTFLLLLIPTLLMGSTLPLLVAHLVKTTENVGESVGLLYAVNTFGSGVACLMAALVLMRVLGESGAVRMAACLNLAVGVTALLLRNGMSSEATAAEERVPGDASLTAQPRVRFALAMLLAGMTGFVALGFEILWYRFYSFASGGTAPCFAELLGFYLIGIAYSSYVVHGSCRRRLGGDLGRTLRAGGSVVLWGTIAGFLLGPALSLAVGRLPYVATYPLVAVAAGLLGTAFPILAHAAIGPAEQAGEKLSYLYLSNILGSALGSFLIGFVILDRCSTRTTSLLLLVMGVVVASMLTFAAGPGGSKVRLTIGLAVVVTLACASGPLFSHLYDRLLFHGHVPAGREITNLVENRSGVIAVDAGGIVYGGGVYDGRFNLDPMNDTNGLFRAYAIAGLHPHPKQVLIIGLSSGSWAQIVANLPGVEEITIVEINPGYLSLIRQRPEVASLLTNPKVHIVTDDGRRWLVSHPERKFDFVLMNATFNWRANASNLLSADFLRLMRQHLKAGGVAYYNTTWSPVVLYTGASGFPYAMRVSNFIAVSDSPIVPDRAYWKSVLENYRIDGKPVFDLSRNADRTRIEQIVSLTDGRSESFGTEQNVSMETRANLLARLKGTRLLTDDNMITEWP